MLIWATALSKTKTLLSAREKGTFWLEVFLHHCEDKKGIPREKLLCQKRNFLTRKKIFSEQDIHYMHDKIREYNKDNTCPLLHPIPLPTVKEDPKDEVPNAEEVPGSSNGISHTIRHSPLPPP